LDFKKIISAIFLKSRLPPLVWLQISGENWHFDL